MITYIWIFGSSRDWSLLAKYLRKFFIEFDRLSWVQVCFSLHSPGEVAMGLREAHWVESSSSQLSLRGKKAIPVSFTPHTSFFHIQTL